MKKSSPRLYLIGAFALFGGLTVWWVVLRYLMHEPSDFSRELFSGVYGVMALLGAFIGLRAAKSWGLNKSVMGRSLLFFAAGLFAQEFGQITYSLYTLLLQKEIPYPSLGDVGYFGSVLLYIYAAYLLGKVVTLKFSFNSFFGRIQAIILPLVILIASYIFFLRGYSYDGSILRAFLDFGYPLGQAIYLSLALLVYILSNKYLGGIMRKPILLLLFALAVQYYADFTFLYQTQHETWVTAGINDFSYLASYFVMSIALYKFMSTASKLSGGGESAS